ncbi:MAG: hypothetical protein HYY40_10110 [Bacteroidetes bacterium]|nr:hypothetical protein [Bacteroidota bacterium]
MTLTEKKIAENHNEVTIVLDPADYRAEVEKTLEKYRKEARVPGFRNGAIPAGVVMKMFGKEVISNKLSDATSDILQKYVTDNKWQLLGKPLVKNEPPEIDTDLNRQYPFVFELGIFPAVNVQLPSEKFNLYSIPVEDGMVTNVIEDLRTRHGRITEPETAENTDYLKIKFYETGANGAKVKDGFLGGSSFLINGLPDEEIRTKFTGLKKNDVVPLTVNPEQYKTLSLLFHTSEERLKEVTGLIRVNIIKIERIGKASPEDESFKPVLSRYGVKTAGELPDAVRKEFETVQSRRTDQFFLEEVIHWLTEKTEIPLPVDYLKILFSATAKTEVNEADPYFNRYLNEIRKEVVIKALMQQFDIRVTEDELVSHAGILMQKEYPNLFGSGTEGGEEKKEEYYRTFAKISLGRKEMSDNREKMASQIFEKKLTAKLKETIAYEKKEISNKEFNELHHHHNH